MPLPLTHEGATAAKDYECFIFKREITPRMHRSLGFTCPHGGSSCHAALKPLCFHCCWLCSWSLRIGSDADKPLVQEEEDARGCLAGVHEGCGCQHWFFAIVCALQRFYHGVCPWLSFRCLVNLLLLTAVLGVELSSRRSSRAAGGSRGKQAVSIRRPLVIITYLMLRWSQMTMIQRLHTILFQLALRRSKIMLIHRFQIQFLRQAQAIETQ